MIRPVGLPFIYSGMALELIGPSSICSVLMPPVNKYFLSASAEASIFFTEAASEGCDSFRFKFQTALSAVAFSEAVPVTVIELPARAASPEPT